MQSCFPLPTNPNPARPLDDTNAQPTSLSLKARNGNFLPIPPHPTCSTAPGPTYPPSSSPALLAPRPDATANARPLDGAALWRCVASAASPTPRGTCLSSVSSIPTTACTHWKRGSGCGCSVVAVASHRATANERLAGSRERKFPLPHWLFNHSEPWSIWILPTVMLRSPPAPVLLNTSTSPYQA